MQTNVIDRLNFMKKFEEKKNNSRAISLMTVITSRNGKVEPSLGILNNRPVF